MKSTGGNYEAVLDVLDELETSTIKWGEASVRGNRQISTSCRKEMDEQRRILEKLIDENEFTRGQSSEILRITRSVTIRTSNYLSRIRESKERSAPYN